MKINDIIDTLLLSDKETSIIADSDILYKVSIYMKHYTEYDFYNDQESFEKLISENDILMLSKLKLNNDAFELVLEPILNKDDSTIQVSTYHMCIQDSVLDCIEMDKIEAQTIAYLK